MNVYFLTSGLLSIGLAILHALWGEKNLADELFKSNLSDVPRVGFYISYHQITSTLTVSGLGLLAIAFIDSLQSARAHSQAQRLILTAMITINLPRTFR